MATVNLHNAKEALGSLAARVFLGALALVVTVANLPLAGDLIFDFGKAAAVAGAIGAWVASEWASLKTDPHPHDVQLRNTIMRKLLPEVEFLQGHDFEGSFMKYDIRGVRWISGVCDGVQYRFRDKKIEKDWEDLLGQITALSSHIAFKAHFLPGSNDLLSFKTDQDRENHTVLDTTRKNIDQANKMADGVVKNIEALEDLCLQRIGAFDPGEEDHIE